MAWAFASWIRIQRVGTNNRFGWEVKELGVTGKISFRTLAVFAVLFISGLFLFSRCANRRAIEPTPGMETSRHLWVRVLLFDNMKQFALSTPSGFTVLDDDGQVLARFDESCGAVLAGVLKGEIVIGEQIFGGQVRIEPDDPFVFGVNNEKYRGHLQLIVDSDDESFDVINSVPLESYLAGVIGEEMPSYWEAEALKAQTVAARTYCLFIKAKFGAHRKWDVKRTQANQVYGGMSSESPMVWDAVRQTADRVLVCRQGDGEKIFPAYYSSTCGGHTEDSSHVFGDSYETLRGVPCPYCEDVTRRSFFQWPTVSFAAAETSRRIIERYPRFKSLKRIVAIEPHEVSEYEGFKRHCSLRLVGVNGRIKTLRAEDMRLTVDRTGRKIKSNSYEITPRGNRFVFSGGRGFGHAVGMCQYGAEGMARKGHDFRTILSHYFPDSSIRRVQ